MSQPLPYHIPGPAGLVLSTPQEKSKPTPSYDNHHFQHSAWQQMIFHLQAPPYGPHPVESSLSLLRRNALSADFSKLRALPALLDSFSWVGKDAAVTLRDPTATMKATIHAEVFRERPSQLQQGVVLLLDYVAAISYLSRSVGFRANVDASIHLSLQSTNIIRVVKESVDTDILLDQEPIFINPLDSYHQHSKKPPPVVTQRITNFFNRDNSRLALKSKNYHYKTLNTSKSTAIFTMPSCSISRPLYKHQYNNHQTNKTYGFQYRPKPNQQPPSKPIAFQPKNHSKRYLDLFTVPLPPANDNYAQTFRSQQPSATNKQPNVPSITTEIKRNGMQSSTKRHASPAPSTSPNNLPHTILKDDQLDSFLGEVDLDSIIAASQNIQ